ncbi:hypothetical protein BKA70DRAFT_1233764 [Coprinopsis sp. MPI-PUGE-AT-0042]|nr:hypothetical protein BKA70DRAFT_1233764 [Coprinopsis sp. MPI-PUGE-AT-0042]
MNPLLQYMKLELEVTACLRSARRQTEQLDSQTCDDEIEQLLRAFEKLMKEEAEEAELIEALGDLQDVIVKHDALVWALSPRFPEWQLGYYDVNVLKVYQARPPLARAILFTMPPALAPANRSDPTSSESSNPDGTPSEALDILCPIMMMLLSIVRDSIKANSAADITPEAMAAFGQGHHRGDILPFGQCYPNGGIKPELPL